MMFGLEILKLKNYRREKAVIVFLHQVTRLHQIFKQFDGAFFDKSWVGLITPSPFNNGATPP